jgi:hypothetical protein
MREVVEFSGTRRYLPARRALRLLASDALYDGVPHRSKLNSRGSVANNILATITSSETIIMHPMSGVV